MGIIVVVGAGETFVVTGVKTYDVVWSAGVTMVGMMMGNVGLT